LDLGIKGKTALVTAGSRGFGKAVALQLAAEGVGVALCARGQDDLDLTAAEIRARGRTVWGADAAPVLARALDVTDGPAVTGFVAETTAELGSIDLLLVNAGGPPAGAFGELDLDQWEAAYRLTLESAVRLCQAVLPGMMERGWGRVVQVTSVSVLQPVENLLLSSVLRPAVQGLTRSLALEAAASGVTVNSVAPGYHTTSAVERLIAAKIAKTGCTREDVLADWIDEIPLGRLGKPEELASLITFLMSARAGYITGQCIVSDGGWVKGTF
jgi:3-oxoacyl-[acyl-carrier protein] reductase